MKGKAFLDLFLTTSKEFMRETKTGGSLCCSNQALEEFPVLRSTGLVISRMSTLNQIWHTMQLERRGQVSKIQVAGNMEKKCDWLGKSAKEERKEADSKKKIGSDGAETI